VFLASRLANLEAVNNAALERKKRKRKRIQNGGTLSQAEAEVQVDKERREVRRQASVTWWWIQRCKGCGELGHNKRTCTEHATELAE
jgi:hypothetical protein